MNHLAHFVLSGDNEDIIIGNFIADFITNKELPQYTEGVQRGIQLHREIDSYTDSHPIVKQSTKRLHPYHHKYAPVIVDIYYDFLLAKNWDLFAPSYPPNLFGRVDKAINQINLVGTGNPLMSTASSRLSVSVSLVDFTKYIYIILKKRELNLPEGLQKRIGYMIKNNWLMSYTHLEGLNQAFLRIEKHAAFPGNFGNAAHHLEVFMEDFDREFRAFFPELQEHIKSFL